MTEIRSNLIKLTNTKSVTVEPLNGKCLEINTSSVSFLNVQKNDDDYITRVSLEDKEFIEIGDRFKVRIGEVYSVYEIVFIVIETNNKSILLFSSIPTKTTTFLLPLMDKTKLQLRYDTYFINAFITEDSKHIALLYRFTGTMIYKEFEFSLMSDPLFVTHVDYNPYLVMYIFRIEERFEDDINFFKEGKYSKFSKTLRQRIQKFYGGTDLAATLRIINKDESLRKKMEEHLGVEISIDSELASVPDLKKEIYKIE
jgi:hypothetical protein